MGNAEELLKNELELQPGDIIISEMPYQSPTVKDFFPFASLKGFEPGHSALWVDGDRPVAHSVREGYKFPGVRLTGLVESRCVVFRINDSAIAKRASDILKNWSLASKFFSIEDYQATYPLNFWGGRQKKDLKNFYTNADTIVTGPATPFAEPRATHDMIDLMRDPNLSTFSMESLRRAIKFTSRIDLSSPNPISKGQRCTAVLVAAVQAAILEPIVKRSAEKKPFKQYKGKAFSEYADEVLIDGWRATELGAKLLLAVLNNDFSTLFPEPFLFDQRYVTPKLFWDKLTENTATKRVGKFSYFKEKLEITREAMLSKSFEFERESKTLKK